MAKSPETMSNPVKAKVIIAQAKRMILHYQRLSNNTMKFNNHVEEDHA